MNDPWVRAAVGTLWFVGVLMTASGAFAAALRMLPFLHMWRGVPSLAMILAVGFGLLTSYLLLGLGKRP